jgi:hypothetical protein
MMFFPFFFFSFGTGTGESGDTSGLFATSHGEGVRSGPMVKRVEDAVVVGEKMQRV